MPASQTLRTCQPSKPGGFFGPPSWEPFNYHLRVGSRCVKPTLPRGDDDIGLDLKDLIERPLWLAGWKTSTHTQSADVTC